MIAVSSDSLSHIESVGGWEAFEEAFIVDILLALRYERVLR